jgi:hypothetical protein
MIPTIQQVRAGAHMHHPGTGLDGAFVPAARVRVAAAKVRVRTTEAWIVQNIDRFREDLMELA